MHTELAGMTGIVDPRDIPAYTIPEAARYLCMPAQTVRSWVAGTTYTRNGAKKSFKPVIQLARPGKSLLSFFNLTEVHVLRAMRTKHAIQLQAVRRALKFVQDRFGWQRPLVMRQFRTDGAALFVEQLGHLLDVTADGQAIMRNVITHLDRIEWDDDLAARLYPFTRREVEGAPRTVLIDPRFSFGRPVLAQAKISTSVIADRYKSGESVAELAADYGLGQMEIEEGIRSELRIAAA